MTTIIKTTTISALAALLLACTAGGALAQDGGRHFRGDGGRGQERGGDQAAPQDNERRDMTGGEDHRGQRRSEYQADQTPAPAPVARAAPTPPAAVQAPELRQPRAQFRGDGGQGLANGRGREPGSQVQTDGGRDRGDANRQGDPRRWDGDHNRGDNRGWDRRDDRGRPHWQQGRYPQVYRSQQRYRYSGYYRPPIGFYSHNWAFDEFLPRGWWGPDYSLNSWWNYGLPYPPPGYDWVRVGPDALLIDEYSGRVVQVVRDIFW